MHHQQVSSRSLSTRPGQHNSAELHTHLSLANTLIEQSCCVVFLKKQLRSSLLNLPSIRCLSSCLLSYTVLQEHSSGLLLARLQKRRDSKGYWIAPTLLPARHSRLSSCLNLYVAYLNHSGPHQLLCVITRFLIREN